MTSIESERTFFTEVFFMNGSATQEIGEGGDYSFTVARAIFSPGIRRAIVPFTLLPDIIAEGTENFMIRATRSEDGPAYSCISPCISVTTINILDNDGKISAFQLQKWALMS